MANQIHHGQLTANVVATVVLNSAYDQVEVLNRDGSAEIYFTTNGTTPTVQGDDCWVLPASMGGVTVQSADEQPQEGGVATTTIALISSGTPKFTVSGLS